MSKQVKKIPNNFFVGFIVPFSLFSFINLYCVANKVTRSSFMRLMFTRWKEMNKEVLLEAQDKIAKELSISWYKKRMMKYSIENFPNLTIHFEEFCKIEHDQLLMHGISAEDADKIISELRL